VHPATLPGREIGFFDEREVAGVLARMQPSDAIVLGSPLTAEQQDEFDLALLQEVGSLQVQAPNLYVRDPALHVYVRRP
jgi:hypothetical protein